MKRPLGHLRKCPVLLVSSKLRSILTNQFGQRIRSMLYMDISVVLAPVINMLWFLIPLAFFAALFKSPWFKGKVGEFIVSLLLRGLDKAQYTVIHDVTLPTEDGTTQIDHVVVSRYGVFVIETKNMKGWIFGSEKQKLWTQKIFKKSFSFQNPLHQNYKHLVYLAECLEFPQESLNSVVVFIGGSTFKTVMPSNATYGFGSVRYIRSFTDQVLSEGQVQSAVEAIESGRLARGWATNREHVKHVKEIKASKVAKVVSPVALATRVEVPVCDRCGSSMTLRKATKGKNAGSSFYGCSAFPKCRRIMPVT